MGSKSRTKGANFEREIAKELLALTGVTFSRNLRQYQQSGDSDLTPDNDAFPFSIECKRRALARRCDTAWMEQATQAAERDGREPAVIWKSDRQPIRVTIRLNALCPSWPSDHWCDVSLESFAMVASERMNGAA